MRIISDEFFGDLTYDLRGEEWKRMTPIQIPFNGEINELEFFIKDVYPVYTQVKYKLNESLGTELKDEWIKIAEKKILELREFYKKYLVNPNQMMRLTLTTTQIRFLGDCEWYFDNEGFGVSVRPNGMIDVGNEEMIYY